MQYYDISPPLSNRLAVFPGDVPFSRSESMSFSKGHHLGLSSFQTTVHIGAHADAPSHYHQDGISIDQRELKYYMGLCQVIPLKLKPNEVILPYHLKGIEISAPRVLFATESHPDPESWRNDFGALSAELIRELKSKGVILIGIDTPSIDPAQSKSLDTHKAVYEANMAVLEGLILSAVPAGLYQLIALPLKIESGDASPVRAILLPRDTDLARF